MAIQLGSAFGKISIDASGVKQGVGQAVTSLEGLQSKAQALGHAMTNLGGMMTAGFTAPLVIAARSASGTFLDYEKNMNILKSVSEATADEFERMSDLAKELGADLTLPGTSAADAASAMAELSKAGLSVVDVIGAARGVLQLSAAGQLSNARAAEITANALNAFSLEGEEAVRVADLLAAGANSSSAEVLDMADSLQMAAAVFAAAGMEIEELTTGIALMSNSGIQGSDAGTSLKQMLLSLQAPSEKARSLMQDLGISIYDAGGTMLSMREIIAIFQQQMSGLTQEQRNQALATIFGSDAIRAANVVLLGGVEAYDQMHEAVTKTGAAADLASAMMEGLTGSVENVKSAFETASIAAIEPFKEDLRTLLGFLAWTLNAFASLPEPVRKFIVVGLGLLAVLGPILVIFGSIISTVVTTAAALSTLGISLSGVGAGIAAVAGGLIGVLGPAIVAIGPILLVLLPALALLYFAFKNNFMGITDTAKQLWFILKWGFKQMWNDLVAGARSGLAWLRGEFQRINWAEVGRWVILGIVNGLLGGIPMLIASGVTAGKALLDAIKSTLDSHSASREMAKEGQNAGMGLAVGLVAAIPRIRAAANQAAAAAMSAVRQAQVDSTYQAMLGASAGMSMGRRMYETASSQSSLGASGSKSEKAGNGGNTTVINVAAGLTLRSAKKLVEDNRGELIGALASALGGA